MQDFFFDTVTFGFFHPWWLLLLLLLPLVWRLELWYEKRKSRMMFPGVSNLKTRGMEAGWWVHLPQWFVRLSIVLAVLAMGRPQVTRNVTMASDRGIDIVLALDISESMLKEDFGGSRLGAAKDIALRFIRNRPKDRLGLVLFRGKSFTQCPLTLDHKLLGMLVRQVSVDAISDDGTAIGSAILVGTNRLNASVSKEKVLVLLTDGEHNRGEIDPVTAAGIAGSQGIRIYVVGMSVQRRVENTESFTEGLVAGKEDVLRKVAFLTGGRFFNASDERGLSDAFREIDAMERSRLDGPVRVVRAELFPQLLLSALIVLVTGLILGGVRLLRIP